MKGGKIDKMIWIFPYTEFVFNFHFFEIVRAFDLPKNVMSSRFDRIRIEEAYDDSYANTSLLNATMIESITQPLKNRIFFTTCPVLVT